VEWFEYLPADETEEFLEVNLIHAGAARRRLTFSAHGARYERVVEALRNKRFKDSKFGVT
jgi:hypothetical protein